MHRAYSLNLDLVFHGDVAVFLLSVEIEFKIEIEFCTV